MRSLIIAGVLALGGCEIDPPDAFIMCHNANCSYTDPTRDDTMEAFRESIALEDEDGRSIIDGIEIDLIWDPRARRCVFEHDHSQADAAPDAREVVTELAAHLRTKGRDAAWNGTRYFVKLELKAGAAPDASAMSGLDMESLAGCALELTVILERAAWLEAGLELTMLYESESVPQLLTLAEHDGWNGGRETNRQIAMNYSYDPPEDFRDQVGVVTMNWRWARDGDYSVYQSLRDSGIELMMWMYDANQKALGTIEHLAPMYIDTNEARFFRSWVGSGALTR